MYACTEVYIVIHICLKYILVGISIGFILLFSYMDTKYIQCIHPYSPFPSSPTGTNSPRKGLFFPPALHFFFFIKCILIVLGGLPWYKTPLFKSIKLKHDQILSGKALRSKFFSSIAITFMFTIVGGKVSFMDTVFYVIKPLLIEPCGGGFEA
jgi:hypothetical protein